MSSFGEYLWDLGLVLDQALKDAGKRPVFVMGHSMGGALAARYFLEKGPGSAD